MIAPTTANAITYTGPTSYATGIDPTSVAIGDLNADGKRDLITGNYDYSPALLKSVTVLLGVGDGTFGAKTSFGTGGSASSVAIGDLNADGKPDLAGSSFSGNKAYVLLGNGDGTFGAEVDYAAADVPYALAIGDLNGDGKADLAVTASGWANKVSVMLGNGDGTFGARTDFAAGSDPRSVAIGDVNGDGNRDLVTANAGSTSVSVLLGAGDGTFGARTDFATGLDPRSVAIADLNGDGELDLTTANDSAGSVSVLLGVGDGTFGAKTDFATGASPATVAIGDLNADGELDVATADNGGVSILVGDGAGNFGTRTRIDVGPILSSVAIADLNADGRLDLAAADDSSDSVAVLLGKNSVFPATPQITGTTPTSPANDNSPKVVGTVSAAGDPDQVWIYKSAACSGTPATGSVADFTGAGIPVSVGDDSVTEISARAVDAQAVGDNKSACSGSISYTEVSSPPGAALRATPSPVLTGALVSFDASASTGLAINHYEWDLDGNGSFDTDTATTPSVSRSYADAREITVAVRVTNQLGMSAVASQALSVRPAPPPGPVGVTVNNGAQYTNDPNVTVGVVWPAFTQTILFSNDGGFANSARFQVAAETPWTLDSSGPERLPKTVYVRFDGDTTNYTDDIILDQTPPVVTEAELAGRGASAAFTESQAKIAAAPYELRIEASDNASGVDSMQITSDRAKPGAWYGFATRTRYVTDARYIYVRVRDGATNPSSWHVVDTTVKPDTTAPQTRITKHPRNRVRARARTVKVSFSFKANERGSTFKCKLDGGRWTNCTSPESFKVKPGKHVFRVRATDRAGNVDPTPALWRWTVKR